MSDKLIEQWGALSPDSRFTDSAELALRAGVFERQIRRRNLIEFLAGAIVIVLFARSAWAASNAGHAFLALGWLAGIIGTVVILANLYYRASTVQRRPLSLGSDGSGSQHPVLPLRRAVLTSTRDAACESVHSGLLTRQSVSPVHPLGVR